MVKRHDPEKLQAAREAVARGVALLDENEPGWRNRIKKDLFDIGSTQSCILGQTFAEQFKDNSYDASPYDLGVHTLGIDAPEYGFDCGGSFGYPELGTAWEEELWPEMFFVTTHDLDEFRQELLGEVGNTVRTALKDLFKAL